MSYGGVTTCHALRHYHPGPCTTPPTPPADTVWCAGVALATLTAATENPAAAMAPASTIIVLVFKRVISGFLP